ncbi:hypothetical protein AZ20_4432 [Bordetella bronchiseptica E014]|nr:hypothetical protein L576_4607 [Bordetella bronchiseptica OSU054]KAK74268.1 hypothetical protein L507_4285 [Bordetella bronchiseptica CA90 BB02]KDB75775.1 hypothetical protein L494_4455 [Bordetella bronchiseptica CA90 BB1334]KDC13856.1 hypothetical protein AZ20_4432 [Bordetella bronchiseptica E014]KDC22766.1 hypothetical protein L542_4492 [Bordetella bronchiseptica F-1]KDC31253.1 hypothetical protein L504_4606 [Bordetella bronchiseptica F2]KDC33130.1 hypothetical protein L505_4490 [Bordete
MLCQDIRQSFFPNRQMPEMFAGKYPQTPKALPHALPA